LDVAYIYDIGSALSGGAKAGIVIGVIVGVLLIVAGVILLVCWRRRCYGNKRMPPARSLNVYKDNNEIEKNSTDNVDDFILPVATVTDIPVGNLPAYVRTEVMKHEPFGNEFKVS
jgi:hypothetical protein